METVDLVNTKYLPRLVKKELISLHEHLPISDIYEVETVDISDSDSDSACINNYEVGPYFT